MEINTIRYVFANRQPELRRLVVKYGLTPAKNEHDLWRKVNYLGKTFKKEFFKDIADIHPDRELILWNELPKLSQAPTSISDADVKHPEIQEIVKKVIEKKSGACGCSGADGEEESSNCGGNPNCGCGKGKKNEPSFSNADGKSLSDTLKDNMPLVIIGSLILVGGLILLGNRQAS